MWTTPRHPNPLRGHRALGEWVDQQMHVFLKALWKSFVFLGSYGKERYYGKGFEMCFFFFGFVNELFFTLSVLRSGQSMSRSSGGKGSERHDCMTRGWVLTQQLGVCMQRYLE